MGSLLKPIILTVVGLVVIIVVVLLLTGREGTDKTLAPRIAALEEKLTAIEARPSNTQALEGRIAALEQGLRGVQDSVAQTVRSQQDLGSHLQAVARQVETIGRQASAPPSAPKAAIPQGSQQKAGTQEPPQPKPAAKPAAANFYTVQPGDTLYRISVKHGLNVDQLRKLNGLSPQDVIHPGQKLKVG